MKNVNLFFRADMDMHDEILKISDEQGFNNISHTIRYIIQEYLRKQKEEDLRLSNWAKRAAEE